MMNWLSPPATHHASSNWLSPAPAASWTTVQNKQFERALAEYDSDTPERWEKVALRVPGKSSGEVFAHYRDLVEDITQIDAGLVPLPAGYCNSSSSSSFTLDWNDGAGAGVIDVLMRKKGRISDQVERKKGIPWTEDEHRKFLLGLKKYGKGDWRNISRSFVTTRTPTQVASHAQKYFIRLAGAGKDKRRSSIHDITTVNLADESPAAAPSPEKMMMMKNSDLIIPPYGGGGGGGFFNGNGNGHLLLQLR